MKINVDSYLNHEWEQHCRWEEEMNTIQIKGKRLSVEITLDELGTTLEGVMGYVVWLDSAIKTARDGKARNLSFLEDELVRCRTVIDKLDKVWCDEGEI